MNIVLLEIFPASTKATQAEYNKFYRENLVKHFT